MTLPLVYEFKDDNFVLDGLRQVSEQLASINCDDKMSATRLHYVTMTLLNAIYSYGDISDSDANKINEVIEIISNAPTT